jgi:ribosome-associated protein
MTSCRSSAKAGRTPRDRVKRVPMPEDVRDAILMCQTITNHEGRRRQLQFVGKKMRTLDEEEVAVIQRTIDSWKGASKAETAALHALERRRDKLLADDKALTVLLEEHPELDVQHLRTLIRNARKEQAENKPPKAYREIFQILKDLAKKAKAAAAARTKARMTSPTTSKEPSDGAAGDRPGIGLRPRQRRRLRGQGHPALQDWLAQGHDHALPRRDAPDPRRTRADRATLIELVDVSAATWC